MAPFTLGIGFTAGLLVGRGSRRGCGGNQRKAQMGAGLFRRLPAQRWARGVVDTCLGAERSVHRTRATEAGASTSC